MFSCLTSPGGEKGEGQFASKTRGTTHVRWSFWWGEKRRVTVSLLRRSGDKKQKQKREELKGIGKEKSLLFYFDKGVQAYTPPEGGKKKFASNSTGKGRRMGG